MIKLRGRATAVGGGALAVTAAAAGIALAGLPAGSAAAEPSSEVKARVIKDCDNEPEMVVDADNPTVPGNPIHPPRLVPKVICQVEVLEDLGAAWGEASKVWADGKEKPIPACETKARGSKSEGHTTGTNFHIGFQVQVDKELTNKIKPGVQARFGWTMVNTRTSTYGQSFEVPPFHMGWFEVRPALREVSVNVHAQYSNGNSEYDLEKVTVTTPDPGTQDAWVGRVREMTPEEMKTFCGVDEPPADTPSSSPAPEDPPGDSPPEKPDNGAPQGTSVMANVATGRAADVDGGRSEVRAMPLNQADGQKWNLKRQADGRVLIEPAIKPGHALGVNADPRRLDQGIQPFALVSPDGEGANQRWRLIGAGGDAYTIVNESGACLTDPGNQGGTVGAFGCTGGDLQRWRLLGFKKLSRTIVRANP